jgi:predicted 3-demethylubiquinone-9 3-methyltransferase (glyoxalase superfamily)
MTHELYPCIWFDGNAKEAAEFYSGIFKNSSVKQCTPMVVTFEVCGKQVMGLNGGPMFKVNPSISFFVQCSSVEETTEVWNKLIEGGSELIAFGKQPWSELYGWLKDKFGVTWQIMVAYEKGKEQTMCPSLLFVNDKFGQAEEAVKLYTSVFKNSSVSVIQKYDSNTPFEGKVMFSECKLNGYTITAMDGPGDHKYTFNEAVSIVVPCDTQEEIDYYWNTFTKDGGEESQCGWLKDKFGVSWQIVPSKLGKWMTGPHAQEVMQAFMKMKKFIIADLEKIAGE